MSAPRRTRQREQPAAVAPLAAAERSLFLAAVRDVTPLPPDTHAHPPTPRPQPRPRTVAPWAADTDASTPAPPLSDCLDAREAADFLRPELPRQLLRDLRRGRYPVADELDLHGLQRDAARSWLGTFIAENHAADGRCVRIIHGKGLGSRDGAPVLKTLVKGWLEQHQAVLAYCPARPAEGGDGALLVLLRAARRRG